MGIPRRGRSKGPNSAGGRADIGGRKQASRQARIHASPIARWLGEREARPSGGAPQHQLGGPVRHGHRPLRLLGARPWVRLVLFAGGLRAGQPVHAHVPGVPDAARHVSLVVPAHVRRLVLAGQERLRLHRDQGLRLVLARPDVPDLPRVLDHVRGVRPVMQQL